MTNTVNVPLISGEAKEIILNNSTFNTLLRVMIQGNIDESVFENTAKAIASETGFDADLIKSCVTAKVSADQS
jgi:hypothetical protein